MLTGRYGGTAGERIVRRGFLVAETKGFDRQRTAVGDLLVVGRTEDCGLIIFDELASRRHVRIRRRGERFLWQDLGSTNGTLVNEQPMLEGELHPGDRIRIGNAVLRFETEEAPDPPDAAPQAHFSQTMLRNDGTPAPATPPREAHRLLEAVYTVMNAIAANYDPCSLLDKVLETTVQAIEAQRGAIFLAADDGLELAPCPVCGAVHGIENGVLKHGALGEVRVSRTVAARVLEGGESVLYQDTDSDEELNAAESIVALDTRSIICAPLRGKQRILGILYIDSDTQAHVYGEPDMLLSAAVANSAGLALENAHMAQELLDKQRIEQDIAYAWTIQEGFLVQDWPEDARGYAVYGETRPARTVGGDFYDFLALDDGRVGVLIGDVSGKGVPAALTMAQLLAQFRIHARTLTSPAEVLAALNEDLVLRSQRGAFCTLCYVALDVRTGQATAANAGHSAAVHVHAGGAGEFCEASGPPAGIVPGMTWRDEARSLDAGDVLLLYTDGIVEARRQGVLGPDGPLEEYGAERLRAAAANLPGAAPRTLIAAVNEDVRAFCAPAAPHDDCTMIALRRLAYD